VGGLHLDDENRLSIMPEAVGLTYSRLLAGEPIGDPRAMAQPRKSGGKGGENLLLVTEAPSRGELLGRRPSKPHNSGILVRKEAGLLA
jgi:hypothetical protein